MHSLVRDYMPNVGDGLISKGSGTPYLGGMTVLPGGVSVGDILRIGGKTYVAAKAAGAITSVGLGIKNGLCQGVAQCAAGATSAIGAISVTLATVATDGALGTGAIAADEFKNGYIVLFTAGSDIPQVRGITGNTARVATGTVNVTFYLDSPLTTAFTISVDAGEAMQNPWSYCVQDVEIGHPVVGLANAAITSGKYFWCQTWGPAFVSPQALVGVGGSHQVYWRHDGSLDVLANIGTYVSDRPAGFILSESATHTQAAPFIMLQVLP